MKKITKTIACAAAMAALSLVTKPAQAQLSQGTAVVTLTVVDVLVLQVTNPLVPLGLTTVSDYQNGVSYEAKAHLTTSSNRPYDIKVKADGNLQAIGTTGAEGSIPISNVTVQTAPTLSGTYSSQTPLSTSDQPIISNAPAAMAKIYDVKYAIGGGNQDFFKKEAIFCHVNLFYRCSLIH